MSEVKLGNNSGFKVFGLPLYLYVIFSLVMIAGLFTESMATDMAASIALLLFLGITFGEIGERIPIWNEYIGGGPILAFIGTAILVYNGVLPEKYIQSATDFMDAGGFLTLFVVVLITGSVLSLERKLLIRSFVGYIPAILGGVLFAFIFGTIGGLLTGISFTDVAIRYVLPIMGGGNGAGAVPLSEIWESTTGQPREAYYSFAIAILTIGNIFAIMAGALLNKLGNAKPDLTGDGTDLIRSDKKFDAEQQQLVKPTIQDYASGFLLVGMFYGLGRLFADYLLPSIGGVVIHHFAYMIIFVIIANATGIIPENLRSGVKALQSFFSKYFIHIMMAGVGIAYTDLGELIAAFTLQNAFIAALVVIGAVVGSGLVGYLVGFYPVDTAVTAGLCMANRGGSGDIQVLGAAKRMELMAFAQISSRVGGAMILVIGSIIFGIIA